MKPANAIQCLGSKWDTAQDSPGSIRRSHTPAKRQRLQPKKGMGEVHICRRPLQVVFGRHWVHVRVKLQENTVSFRANTGALLEIIFWAESNSGKLTRMLFHKSSRKKFYKLYSGFLKWGVPLLMDGL